MYLVDVPEDVFVEKAVEVGTVQVTQCWSNTKEYQRLSVEFQQEKFGHTRYSYNDFSIFDLAAELLLAGVTIESNRTFDTALRVRVNEARLEKLQEEVSDLRNDIERIDRDIEPDFFGRRPWDNVG